ncbi:hypothetical protein ACTHQY_05580 [Rhodococcoides corynebacterioides]|uniref:hypothetical protein n=1 Tax=Rhodococcoides corynebacterioides TaxID=53972 RepID=UPI003F7CF4B8
MAPGPEGIPQPFPQPLPQPLPQTYPKTYGQGGAFGGAGAFGAAFTPSAPSRAYASPRPESFPSADSAADTGSDSRDARDDDAPRGLLESRYEWIVGMMYSFTDERVVRIVIAFFTAAMGVCATLEILFGFGARTQPALGIQIGCAAFAFTAALWWLVTSWPRLWTAFVFVVLADIGIIAANLSADMPPEFAIGKTAFLAVLGLFAGVFLDRWMLAVHLVLSAGGVTAIIAWLLFTGDVPVLGALVVWAPVSALCVAIPALLYTFVRAVRLDQN